MHSMGEEERTQSRNWGPIGRTRQRSLICCGQSTAVSSYIEVSREVPSGYLQYASTERSCGTRGGYGGVEDQTMRGGGRDTLVGSMLHGSGVHGSAAEQARDEGGVAAIENCKGRCKRRRAVVCQRASLMPARWRRRDCVCARWSAEESEHLIYFARTAPLLNVTTAVAFPSSTSTSHIAKSAHDGPWRQRFCCCCRPSTPRRHHSPTRGLLDSVFHSCPRRFG